MINSCGCGTNWAKQIVRNSISMLKTYVFFIIIIIILIFTVMIMWHGSQRHTHTPTHILRNYSDRLQLVTFFYSTAAACSSSIHISCVCNVLPRAQHLYVLNSYRCGEKPSSIYSSYQYYCYIIFGMWDFFFFLSLVYSTTIAVCVIYMRVWLCPTVVALCYNSNNSIYKNNIYRYICIECILPNFSFFSYFYLSIQKKTTAQLGWICGQLYTRCTSFFAQRKTGNIAKSTNPTSTVIFIGSCGIIVILWPCILAHLFILVEHYLFVGNGYGFCIVGHTETSGENLISISLNGFSILFHFFFCFRGYISCDGGW